MKTGVFLRLLTWYDPLLSFDEEGDNGGAILNCPNK